MHDGMTVMVLVFCPHHVYSRLTRQGRPRHLTRSASDEITKKFKYWRKYSGGSRISRKRDGNLSFGQISPKIAWKWRKLDREGGSRPKFYYFDPPLKKKQKECSENYHNGMREGIFLKWKDFLRVGGVMTYFSRFKQECIPVGCVPPAHWPYLVVSAMHTPLPCMTPSPAMHTSHHTCPPVMHAPPTMHTCLLPHMPPPHTHPLPCMPPMMHAPPCHTCPPVMHTPSAMHTPLPAMYTPLLTAPDRCYHLNQASLTRNKGRAGEFPVGEDQ